MTRRKLIHNEGFNLIMGGAVLVVIFCIILIVAVPDDDNTASDETFEVVTHPLLDLTFETTNNPFSIQPDTVTVESDTRFHTLFLEHATFYETTEPSYIKQTDTHRYELYLNDDELKTASKRYIETFGGNLPLEKE